LGRHFVGIDLDKEYVAIASKKIEHAHETKYKGFMYQFIWKDTKH